MGGGDSPDEWGVRPASSYSMRSSGLKLWGAQAFWGLEAPRWRTLASIPGQASVAAQWTIVSEGPGMENTQLRTE